MTVIETLATGEMRMRQLLATFGDGGGPARCAQDADCEVYDDCRN